MKYVFYVNVGALPPKKAEEFVERTRERAKQQNFFEPTDKVLYIPTRTRETTLEILDWGITRQASDI